MVAAEDFGVDTGIGYLGHQSLADHEVVDAPTGILLTGLETIRPPRVLHLIRMERAVGIAEATRKQIAELLALLVGKAGIMTIGLGVLDVDFLVGYIQVATEDDGFLLVDETPSLEAISSTSV